LPDRSTWGKSFFTPLDDPEVGIPVEADIAVAGQKEGEREGIEGN
jgi:hypothetical protein